MLASTFSAGHAGMKTLFMRLLFLPLLMALLWCLYFNSLTVHSHGKSAMQIITFFLISE